MRLKHTERTAAGNGGMPVPGRWIAAEQGDRARWLQTSEYTPVNVSRILEAANEGDIAELAVAAREIQERNWEVILAMQVRKSALTGLDWGVEPGDERPASKDAALAFEAALKGSGCESGLVSFHELADHLMDAVIAPLSAAEIVWDAGGSLAGFRPVSAWHFTFRNSETPLLVTDDNYAGVPLPPAKFIVHTHGGAGDPARAGLIRTLIWLHVFQNYPVKDLVSFVERYGMPFVVAKVDRSAWENERGVMRNLIRSFGPNGGGVFTKSTELELLQATNAGGDVYFKLLEYTSKAITKVILGQLVTNIDTLIHVPGFSQPHPLLGVSVFGEYMDHPVLIPYQKTVDYIQFASIRHKLCHSSLDPVRIIGMHGRVQIVLQKIHCIIAVLITDKIQKSPGNKYGRNASVYDLIYHKRYIAALQKLCLGRTKMVFFHISSKKEKDHPHENLRISK